MQFSCATATLTFELIDDAAVKVVQAGSTNYCTRIVSDLAEIGAGRWNALLAHEPANPFVRYEFLQALQASGCASERTGWEPHHLTLWSGAELKAAAPLYRKHHSYGEYVFDWAWADAHQRHGIDYYPKWLVAIPFTPVPGPRLLAVDAAARDALAAALQRHAEASGLSSLHVLFLPEADAARLAALGQMTRRSVQFHWFNRGYAAFDDYLAALTQPKRKKVRAERRKVADAGVTFVRKVGTRHRRGRLGVLRALLRAHVRRASLDAVPDARASSSQLAQSMPETLLLVVAQRDGRPIASALALFDAERLYGRYWGAVESVPCLHFETSYYQMIEFAIERRLAVFEGGAQGEHKLARGFEPVTTFSSHWLAHPAFNDAVQRYLEREHGGIEAYVDELNERSALRRDAAKGRRVTPTHLAAALLMVTIWGFNFVVIRWGLDSVSPYTLNLLRFVLAAFPALLFVRPPRAPWHLVAGYGLFAFTLQFCLLFAGMAAGMPTGLASLVIQMQVFFTIGLVTLLTHERARRAQLFGAAVAGAGIVLVALHLPPSTLLGFALTLGAAASWAVANMIVKRIPGERPLAVVVWASAVAADRAAADRAAGGWPGLRLGGDHGDVRLGVARSRLPGVADDPARVRHLGVAAAPSPGGARSRPSRCWCRSSA